MDLIGISVKSTVGLNWNRIYGNVTEDLSPLDMTFSLEDIWIDVFLLPAKKSPEPDGFSTCVYQAFWDIKKIC